MSESRAFPTPKVGKKKIWGVGNRLLPTANKPNSYIKKALEL
jgi:hypothetical protein